MSSGEVDSRSVIKVGSRKSEVSSVLFYVASPNSCCFLTFWPPFTYAARTHSNEVCSFMSAKAFSHNQVGNP